MMRDPNPITDLPARKHKPRQMTVPYGDRPPWADMAVHHMFNEILQCQSKHEMKRVALRLSEAAGRGTRTQRTKDSGAKPVLDLLYKFGSGRCATPYQPHPVRVNRSGVGWSYVDDYLMDLAFSEENDGRHRKRPHTIESMAAILSRPPAEVADRWRLLYGGLFKEPPFAKKKSKS